MLEKPPFLRVACAFERGPEVLARARVLPEPQLEFALRGKVERVCAEPLAILDRGDFLDTALADPACCAIAIARLSAITGEGRIVISVSYSEMMIGQFVSSAPRAMVCTAAIAAST